MSYKKNDRNILIILLSFLFVIYSCSSDDGITIPEINPNPTDGEISVVITTPDQNALLKELANKVPFESGQSLRNLIITIDENQTQQTVDGFGAALTGSSAFLLNDKPEALDMLFGEDGIKLSYVRLTVGASDFNKNGNYTYNDISELEDLNLDQFSVEEDQQNDNPVIPVAKNIMSANPDINFMASPWSPPAWMKSNRALNGGSLLEEYYDVYADYLIKYIDAYKDQGLNIHTITVQNEPLNETFAYPSMKMSAIEQATFIGDHFGPKLANTEISTKIIGYDHNFREEEDPSYPLTLLEDTEASQYTNAIAYHAYGGQPDDISNLIDQFPNAEIYFTEQSGIQNDGTTFGGEIDFFMKNVFMGTLRRGSKTVLLWNLALDENAGPKNGGCTDCRGVLKITSGGTIIKNVEYYMLGHFSKYVDSGAQVIHTNNLNGLLENVAFKNPDGTKVLIVYNTSNDQQELGINVGSENFNYSIPKGALVTFKWD
ncbi:glycoside hydrolase family 30 protein [Aquimarina sp. M1]